MVDIRTERLLWRPPGPDDLDGYHALVSDYEVVKWTASWPYPANRDFTLSRCIPVDPARGQVGLALLGDQIIGAFGAVDGELGYMFSRDHWGQGYATEIGRAVVDFAFANHDWQQLKACIFDGNDGSGRVLEKLGFTRVGTCNCACRSQGATLPTTDYVLTRADWLAAQPLLIETERLLVKPFATTDTAAFHRFASQGNVARMMQSIPHPLSQKAAADWITERQYTGRLGFCPGVYLKDGTLIGTLGIGGDPVSVAYFFDPDHWNKGYATEAMSAFLHSMFDQFGLDKVEAGAMEDNPASQRVLIKLGFVEVGRKLHKPALRVEPDPLILYRLSRNRLKADR